VKKTFKNELNVFYVRVGSEIIERTYIATANAIIKILPLEVAAMTGGLSVSDVPFHNQSRKDKV